MFHLTVFPVSFLCSGKKGGEVDLTFSLNYTKFDTSPGETDGTKTFVIVVRKLCLQTGMHEDYYYFAIFVIDADTRLLFKI